jgi:uncharacterized SAM-binding protein YcdF (DUF218 family)
MYRFLVDLLQPFLVLHLVTACLLALLWLKAKEIRRRVLVVSIAFAVLFLASTRAVSYVALGTLEWRHPPRSTRGADTEAIVVLGGGILQADEVRKEAKLSDSTLRRCNCAAELYRRGDPCVVVVSGGKVDPTEPGLPSAQLMRSFLIECGVRESDVVVEDRSRTTYENAVESGRILREIGISKIAVVTDATHLPRSERCFRTQGFEVVPCGCYYRATRFDWRVFDFLPSAGAATEMQDLFHEWLGMIWYFLHGRI